MSMPKQLMTGNQAVIKGEIMAGCRAFYGYPITPASEIADAAAYYMPRAGGVFLQAESEVAAINMLYGAASAGVRVMTASERTGHQPHAGGRQLPGRRRTALCDHRHHAGRTAPGKTSLPNKATTTWRRTRQLSHAGARARFGTHLRQIESNHRRRRRNVRGRRVTVGDKPRFTYVEGPEFDAHPIDFQELR